MVQAVLCGIAVCYRVPYQPGVCRSVPATPVAPRAGATNKNMQVALISGIVALDDRVVVWLGQFVSKWPLFNLFVAWLIDARIVKFLPFVLVICWFWFERTPMQELRRKILLESVMTSLVAVFVARLLALTLPFRDRPVANPGLHLVIPLETGLRTWSSFPSDHAPSNPYAAAALNPSIIHSARLSIH